VVTTSALLSALRLDCVGENRYCGGQTGSGAGVVTGGQLLGQSLVAASIGHESKIPKTIQTVFARAARSDLPIDVVVRPMQSGRSFASSTVTISQNDRVCAQSLVLLSAEEPDLISHADRAGTLAPPESSPDDGSWQVHIADGVDLTDPDAVGPPELDVWVRFDGAPPEPLMNQALLAYSTDFFLIGTAMRPHPGVGQSQAHKTLSTGVITHTLTFHEPASAAEWTLMRHHSTYAGHGRSHGRADVFRRDGTLVASFVQDAMIRPMGEVASGQL
jgi:acyl-CoA thioesterase II